MRRTLTAYLCLGALSLIIYPVVPGAWQHAIYVTAAIGSVLAVVVGVHVHRPASPTPWRLIATGFAVYLLADIGYSVLYPFSASQRPTYPNVADIAYQLYYVLLFASLASFLRKRALRDGAAWIDAMIWTIGLTVLAWEPLLEGYVLSTETLVGTKIVALLYPVLDLGLLLMVLRLVAGRQGLTPAFLFLSTGMLVQTVSDMIYSDQLLAGTYAGGPPLELGWVLAHVMVGAAALHPSMVGLAAPVEHRDVLASRWRLASLGVAGMAGPALLVVRVLSGDLVEHRLDLVVVAVSIALVLGLAVARGSGLIAVSERQVVHLLARKDELELVMHDRELLIDKLNRKVSQDALTGLASRDQFVETLDLELATGGAPSVAFLDLDDFKTINDTLGHEAGDELLREVARRLHAAVEAPNVVARFGGDEFAVLFSGSTDLFAELMVDALRPPLMLEGRQLELGVSIGVTTARPYESVAGDLLREADIAMYSAKRSGGGWAKYLPGMSALLLERMDLRGQLVDALRDGEIVPWFQPVVELTTGRLVGVESLARWCRAGQPARDPGSWLPLAEETGLIVLIDRAMFRAAVAQLVAWRSRYDVDGLRLAVNLSGRTLQYPGIAEEMLEALTELGLPADRLTVEVTEGVLIEDERVSARLQILRTAGVKVALDDFGTGWSSLSYLRRFPVDVLKLDQTFTAELVSVSGGDAIPAAVTQLARALGLDLVVEGVETHPQRVRLLELGFAVGQGYLFGRAQPAPLLEPRLEELSEAAAQLSRR